MSLTSPLSSPMKKPTNLEKSPTKIATEIKNKKETESKSFSMENYDMQDTYQNDQINSPSYNDIYEETDKSKNIAKDKYPNLLPNEVFMINNYVRENLWRRAKILSNAQLNGVIEKMNAESLKLSDNDKATKWSEICTLVGNNLNYRRAYANKLMKQILIGK
jgi:hypothetical protein